jgi:hypothetical protein
VGVIKRKIAVLTIAIYVGVFAWVFSKNLTADTDYPYHMHSVWAVNQGYLARDPFINGGSTPTLMYGGPPLLLGGAIYPVFGVYTVAVLMLLAFPLLWYFSRRLFCGLAKKRVAELATLFALINPLTLQFFITAKLPFIWAVAFGLASLGFYLEGKTTYAALTGMLAVITHPLSVFLLATILLIKFDVKMWLKPYLPTCLVVGALGLLLFGVPGAGGGGQIFVLQTAFLAAILITLFAFRKESRVPCSLSLLAFACSVTGVLGVGISTVYFDRIAWFILILAAPFFIKLTLPRLKLICVSAGVIGALLLVPAVWARPTFAFTDNPVVYENLAADNQTLSNLRSGYVRYSGDGSALYILPISGIKFSNSGQEMLEFSLDNGAQGYYTELLEENVSFVLVYRTSPEENYLVELHFPLAYSKDNLRIYEIPH